MSYEQLMVMSGDQALVIRCEDCGETFFPHHPLAYPLCDPCDEAVRAQFADAMREGPVFGDELADAWEQEARA